ncbi:MAG: hypothetical protein Q9181_005090 [Wetmoreana brouardii]
MSAPFATRRKARVIAQDDGDEGAVGQAQHLSVTETSKPTFSAMTRLCSDFSATTRGLTGHVEDNAAEGGLPPSPRASSKTRKKASSRISFGPGGTSMTEDDEENSSAVFTVKKSNLSRQAIEKNALRKSMGTSLPAQSTPLRQSEDRPSYSTDYLNELKSSTPSTPRDIDHASHADTEESEAIDLAAKFGSDLSVYETSAIPTDAEIQEKKARRARLAKEEEYINLQGSDESDNDDNEIALRLREKHPETRLVRDDEDVAEGFDEYVDDGRIALGRKAEREQQRKQKSEMEALINEAEGGSSSDETDDSEVERRQAYEVAQTRAGMDGLQKNEDSSEPRRPRTPPKITPLPTVNGCLEKLRASLTKMEYEKMLRVKKLDEVRKEKAELAEREVDIQRLLREAGENYAKLQSPVGGELAAATNGHVMIENGSANAGRGLENLGPTTARDVEMNSP